MDVIVGGGGVIGLSVGLELARNGLRVRVIEKGRAMAEASWAAAGMLAAHDPDHPEGLAKLAELSAGLYPKYLELIECLSGHPVPLRTRGTVIAACLGSESGVAHAATACALDEREAEKRIPGLVTTGHCFFWMEEASLDPRDLCVALPLAAMAAGVDLLQETTVLAVTNRGGSVEVKTEYGAMSAGAFVNCCGAWAGQVRYPGLGGLGGLGGHPAAAVEPRKGQMFTLRVPPPVELPYVLRGPKIYLVPRGQGLIAVGATVERVGFDRRVEPAVARKLLAHAAELWPCIASGAVVESWSGLRPGTDDELPLIGSAGEPHCWIATGHFRNGILLAPATGLVVRQLLQGLPPAVSLAAFLPGR